MRSRVAFLQDADRASRLAEITPSGIDFVPAIRSRWLKSTSARQVSGHLGTIAGKRAALYAAGGRLWFAIDGDPWFLEELDASVQTVGDARIARIRTPARVYEDPVTEQADSMTPFSEDEDFNFGLWVARVISEPSRQQVLLEVLVDAPLTQVPTHVSESAPRRLKWPRDAMGDSGGVTRDRDFSAE